MLMPLLAKLAEDYDGKFFLAKVNTDVEQGLATHYGIRSLPTVKLFKDGQIIDEFMGVQPERMIRALLDRHIPRPSDAVIDRAVAALRAGHAGEATQLLGQVLQAEPSNDRARLELAGVLIAQGNFDEAAASLDDLSAQAKADPRATELRGRLEFARVAAAAPPVTELERTVTTNPNDCPARYQLAAVRVLAGDYERALPELLEIVRRDRKFGDDAGRKAMLAVFGLLGSSGELVKKYRALLSNALN
jgi:putative thioredoxin